MVVHRAQITGGGQNDVIGVHPLQRQAGVERTLERAAIGADPFVVEAELVVERGGTPQVTAEHQMELEDIGDAVVLKRAEPEKSPVPVGVLGFVTRAVE